jgi:general stress protein CsbA
MIPLSAGGLFTLALIWRGMIELAGPATLIFYGIALFNAGRYTLNDIRYLGIIEIALGLLAVVFIGYTAIFWAIGFGLLHIIYGLLMYFKYER